MRNNLLSRKFARAENLNFRYYFSLSFMRLQKDFKILIFNYNNNFIILNECMRVVNSLIHHFLLDALYCRFLNNAWNDFYMERTTVYRNSMDAKRIFTGKKKIIFYSTLFDAKFNKFQFF